MVPFALLATVVCVLHPPAGPLQSDTVDGFLTGKISDSDRFFDRFWLENWSHANYRYKWEKCFSLGSSSPFACDLGRTSGPTCNATGAVAWPLRRATTPQMQPLNHFPPYFNDSVTNIAIDLNGSFVMSPWSLGNWFIQHLVTDLIVVTVLLLTIKQCAALNVEQL